jgi:hypothetical protein
VKDDFLPAYHVPDRVRVRDVTKSDPDLTPNVVCEILDASRMAATVVSHKCADSVSTTHERLTQVTADEPTGTGDEDASRHPTDDPTFQL